MRVIAQAGVIAHAGVIAPLCVNFSSLESFNLFSAQGSESSHRGAMTPILVPPSSVRLHAVVCGLRIKIVPRSVFLAVCDRGSPLFVAGAYHAYMKKNSRFCYFLVGGDFLVTSNSPLLPFSAAFLSVGFFVFLCCVCSGCGSDEPQEGRHTGSSAYQFPPSGCVPCSTW